MKAVSISLHAQIQGSWTQSGLLYSFWLWLVPRKSFFFFFIFQVCLLSLLFCRNESPSLTGSTLQVFILFIIQGCLYSYRALPTSDVAIFFSSLGLKPHPSFQKEDVQDTSREERFAPQWKTALVIHKSGKRLISLFLFFCESIKKPTSLCPSVTRNYHPKSNKRQYEVAIIVQIFKICFLSLTSRLFNVFSSKTYLVWPQKKPNRNTPWSLYLLQTNILLFP